MISSAFESLPKEEQDKLKNDKTFFEQNGCFRNEYEVRVWVAAFEKELSINGRNGINSAAVSGDQAVWEYRLRLSKMHPVKFAG